MLDRLTKWLKIERVTEARETEIRERSRSLTLKSTASMIIIKLIT